MEGQDGGSAPAPVTPAPAPAAPVVATPAATAPATPATVTPNDGGAPATEAASEKAREALRKGGTLASIFGTEATPVPAAGSEPDATTAAAADGSQSASGEPAAPEAAGGEGEQPAGDEPPNTDEGGESEDDLIVELPGRRPEDPALQIRVDDKETADRLRQLQNGFLRGEQVREERAAVQQEIQRYQTERAEFEDMVATDPVGLITESLPPEIRAHVALSLLTDDAVLEQIAPHMDDLQDPDRLEMLRLRMERDQLRMKETLQTRAQVRRAATENAVAIRNTVEQIASLGLSPEATDQFMRDAISDISAYAANTKQEYIDPRHIPLLLAARLQTYGMNPVEIAAKLAEAGLEVPPKNGALVSGVKKLPGKIAAPALPQKTGTQFVKQAAARKKVAATAPAGGGAPAPAVNPPPNQTIEERTKWHREHRGLLTPRS